MRVALIALYWKGRGGATASALTYIPGLRHWGVDINLVAMSCRGQYKKSEPPTKLVYAGGIEESIDVTRLRYDGAAEYLNKNYDLVHFLTMGETSQDERPAFMDVVEKLKVPWMFSVHAPNDFRRYKFWEEQVTLGDFRGAHFVSESLRIHGIATYPKYFNDINTVSSGPIFLPAQVDIGTEKEPLVVQHSRLASIKGAHHTVEMADELLTIGISEIRVYGRCEFFSYDQRLKSMPNYDLVTWPGPFEFHDVPIIMKPAMFDLDFTYHGHSLDDKRPQYTALEAAAYGAIPVIQDQWCSDLLRDGDNVIAVRHGHEVEDTLRGIESLLNDSDRRATMINNNKEFVTKWFERSKVLADFYSRITEI